MSSTIEFIFDFASPNAYLARIVLEEIAGRIGAAIKITPCLLGGIFKATGNQAPMTAFGGVRGKLAYDMLETQRFIAAHRLTRFTMNPHFPLNSLVPMRGLIAAQKAGLGADYLTVVLSGFWEKGLKMDDPEVLSATLSRAGLDGAALLSGAQDPEVKQALIANTDAAVARGVFGIPTFFVGEEMFFGKERLGQVEAEVVKFSA